MELTGAPSDRGGVRAPSVPAVLSGWVDYQDIEKVFPWLFLTEKPENAVSRFLHIQWLSAIEVAASPFSAHRLPKITVFQQPVKLP